MNNTAKTSQTWARLQAGFLAAALILTTGAAAARDHDDVPYLPTLPRVVSTIPTNGDANPYGVAFVPKGFPSGGMLNAGDVLVSNFNNAANLQGTGTTIIRTPATGSPSLFFQAPAPAGLTAALVVLRAGYVIVGSLPTLDGTSATAKPGSLFVIDKNGKLVSTLTNPALVDGPWGAAVQDYGSQAILFISNVINGTIVRFTLNIGTSGITFGNPTTIASGYTHRPDPAALELGPSGLFYDARHDELFVASSADNAVYAVYDAGDTRRDNGVGRLVYQDLTHLHGPLDLAMAPNGHLLVADSDGSNMDPNQPSEIVEFTTDGQFVRQLSIDPNNGGAFGLAVERTGDDVSQFAAVDDNAVTLTIWTLVSAD